jgi:chromosome segregation protein
MYIAQLQLKGFKSFGGDHDLSLSPGLTCIVGPNGSGKSNLLDAMRWVLGEGAPSDLRISRQTDLLFQGSASVPSCRETEVAVRLLAGNDGCLVRRKVDREGTASVTVNGNRVRLQDLEQVKRDWGLEGVRFAFIGQGEISEIIQQKPLQRRMLLEGLFGIDLYRRKREEAVDRLKRAEEELLRLATLLSELSARRNEIAPMVEKARRAKEVLTTLEDQRRVFYWLRRERSESALESLRNRRSMLEREQATHAFWSEGWTRRRDLLERSLAIVQKEMESCREEGNVAFQALQGTLRQAASLASALRRDRDQLKEAQAESLRKRTTLLDLEREEKTQRDLAESLEAELSEKRAAARAARQARLKRQEELERQNNDRKTLSRKKAEQDSATESLKVSLEGLGRHYWALVEEKRKAGAEALRLGEALAKAERSAAETLNQCEAAIEFHSAAFAASQKAAADIARHRKQVSQLASELESLSQKMDGQAFPRPVQFLMAAARLGRISTSPLPVIEAFECPPRFEKALESFLGARQFWLLVKDMDEARLCIEGLRQASAGRATFLPLERCRLLRPVREVEPKNEPGVLGWAIDLLGIAEKWKKAMGHILGDLLLVEDYDTAARLVRCHPRLAVATLEGDVFMPGGSVSGGSQKSGSGVIELRRRRKQLETLLEEAHNEADRLQAILSEAESLEIRTAAEKEELFGKRREAEENLRLLKAEKDRVDREDLRLQEAGTKTLETISGAGRSFGELFLERKKTVNLLCSMEKGIEDQTPGENISNLETEVLLSEERRRGALELLGRVEKEKRGILEALKRAEEEVAGRGRTLDKILVDLSDLGKRYLSFWEKGRETRVRESGLSARAGRDRKDLVRVVAREGRAQEAFRRCRTRFGELEREILEAGNSLAELAGEWEEKFPYPGKGAGGEADLEDVKRAIRNAEKTLRAMGDVEMGVLSEEESLRERTTFLSEQCADVREGIRTLQEFIAETDSQASRVFSLAMEGIDRRFDTLFQRLFGGGEAHLEIEAEGEVWEAGVEVTARPPGKRPQGLAQLSGGEQSLTAIALLFAAMEEARVPIAILDEADAALDEVNLRRYVDLAGEYARDLQILAMTHRRTTMEKADVLYGVTLSEPGLSQVVGVRMEDWA